MRPHGRARISRTAPQAQATCDRCGFVFPHASLRWQYDWQGPKLQNKRILVCPNGCYDKPQEGRRTILIPPDPLPILNPRPELFVADDNPIQELGWSASFLFPGQSSNPMPSWTLPGAVLDLDFIGGVGFPLSPAAALTDVRGSTAGIRAAGSGVYSTVAGNALRLTADDALLQNSGLLVEGTVTNAVASPNFSGAVTGVVGAGGSLPSGWSFINSSGVTLTVNDFDSSHITISVSGTPGSTASSFITMQGTTSFAAAPGDIWTFSLWQRQITYSGLNNTFIALNWINAGGGEISVTGSYEIDGQNNGSPSNTDITFPYQTTTTAPATTAFVQPTWGITTTAGTPVNAQFRIETPQAEKSVIRTTFQAGTRAADTVTLNNFSTLWNGGTCSGVIVADVPRQSATGTLLEISDGTTSNRFTISLQSYALTFTIVAAGVTLTNHSFGPVAALSRIAVAYAVNGTGTATVSVGGSAVFSGSGIPAIVNRMQFGGGSQGAWNSTICRYAHYDAVLSAAAVSKLAGGLSFVFDDFQRPNGAPGNAISGQTYIQVPADSSGRVVASISGNKLVAVPNAAGFTAAYTSVQLLARLPQFMLARLDYTALTSGGNGTLISNPEGGNVVNDVSDRSIHIVFADAALGFDYALAGVLTTAYTYSYPTAATRDGATAYSVGWGLRTDGSLVALAPGGELLRVTGVAWPSYGGSFLMWENFSNVPTQTMAEFQAIGAR